MPSEEGRTPLTPTALAGHLACGHLTQLQRAVAERRLQVAFRPDPRLQALQQRGLEHELAFVARLQAQGRRVLDLRERHDPAATAEALRQGVDVVVQAPLDDGVLRGRADVLVRVGELAYEPYDTKLAQDTKAGTLLQLSSYAELLAPLQGHAPEHLHVVTPLRTETYRTADFASYVRLVRRNLLAARSGPPRDGACPDPVPHCDVCSFWHFCDQRRRAADHLSLVAGLGTLHARELTRQGLTTVAALARSAGRLREPPRRGRAETYQRLAAQATLQVAARATVLPPFERLPFETGRGLGRLPEPSPGDVFLDFEGDPFVGEGGLEYLTGWTCADQPAHYGASWAMDRAQEKAALEAFLDLLAARWQQHPQLHVYHFAPYEPAALKRMAQRHGTGAAFLDQLLRGGRFVDLHAVMREGLRVGVERYGLKQLEPLFGFQRELPLEQAAQARLRVELSLELGDPDAITAGLRQELETYNRDDCRATQALRDWLEARRSELLGQGIDVPRPPQRDGAPGDTATARAQAIAAVADALREGVPADPAARGAEQVAHALLADQLGYFLREEKCAWWEHFRLRDLEHEALFEEREALAGLEFVRPLLVKGSKLPADQYRFPPQESALDAGDRVYVSGTDDPTREGPGTRLGKVTAVDLAAGTVTIHKTKATVGLHPRAVFQDQVVPAGAMETALLALGAQVRDQGIGGGGRFTAAAALLRREPPRARPGPANEDNLAAAARRCSALDGEVLPIQGPPGTGKTHTGAHAILALVAQGKRVGVTAVSHKVIDNLLDKVGELARQRGAPVRLVHKDDGGASTLVEYRDDNDDALTAVVAGTVVGGTAWFWAREAATDRLDHLFVDEAGQMALAQVLAAARSARNLVLLGDPQQLEQPRRGAHPEGAEVAALVHLIGPDRKTLTAEQGLFLDQTWRLHPALCAFTSELYYDGRLHSRAGLERQRIDGDTPFAGAGLFLVEVEHEANQSLSREEIDAVERTIGQLLRPGVQWTNADGKTRPLASDDLLVVAPYNAQVAALRTRLRPCGVTRVGTVDKFQGQEAAVVLYSCTSSSAQDAPRGMDFLYDPHRFNVATSRARSTVIVVGSPRLFEPECRTPEQVRMANGLCRYRELATVVPLRP